MSQLACALYVKPLDEFSLSVMLVKKELNVLHVIKNLIYS